MVSFFGFRIGGGDKKKKLANEADASSNQLRRKHEQDALLGKQDGKNAPDRTAYPASRPDTSYTGKVTASRTKASPYGSGNGGVGAMSLSELTESFHPNLKQWASNPNMGSNRFNASTSDLASVPPVPIRNPSRPATPVKQQPTWMNPLDMHSTRGPTLAALSASRSPLEQLGLKLDIPKGEAPTSRDDESPKPLVPLRIRKPSHTPQTVEPPNMCQSPRKPPSPPQSVKDMDRQSPVRGRPAFNDEMFRPSSRGSQRNVTTNLKAVQNAWDMPSYGPTSIPSPVSTPRGSEEKATGNMMNLWCEPVIQSVEARRDTMTSITHHKMSMEIKLEDLEKMFADEPIQLPRTFGSQARQLVRPPPLNLDPRPRTPDRAGTYPPAPFMMDHRPHTPTGESSRRPMRDRNGPPPSAFGAQGRPSRPNTKNVRRPAVDEYVIQPQSQPQSRRVSQDSSRPTSPDSPLLPQYGPLASPRFLPIDAQLAPPPLKAGARSNLHIQTFALDDDDMDDQLMAPCMGHRNAPTPDSSQWPMPSPTASSFEGTPSYRAESPFMRADSPLETPPRVLPQGVVGRSESPFGFRSFNFSRPMTPTLEQPPLRRDETPLMGRFPRYPPKRSETVPVSPGFRDYESSPSPARLPPPRANTVTVNVGHGLRSPAIVGDDFGGGFI
ncbi:hypothetical protein F4781DRAFT_420113 [Annulohypoxylon bovei var. microspora]|nr:hypothetical protein F4781DRAFT_420113 [Annulohypoxylon bovei var. microspora]